MRKKSSLLIIVLLIFVSLMTGCGKEKTPPSPLPSQTVTASPLPPTVTNKPLPSVEVLPPDVSPIFHQPESLIGPDIFFTLSSEALSGRKMGSQGSLKAQEILTSLFEGLGLKPWYENTYKDSIFLLEAPRVATSVVITFEDQSTRTLMASQDYFISPSNEITGQYRVLYDQEPAENEKVLYIIDDGTRDEILEKDAAAGFIYRKSSTYKSVEKVLADKLHLFVSEDILEQLKASAGTAMVNVHVPPTEWYKMHEGNNIIGWLPGADRKECIIISAHFDGTANNTAALDNASGTYTLLRTAEKLSEYIKFNQPGRDIIFALFDGEELGLVGSGFFAEQIKDKYEDIIVINIDCVGLRDTDSYMAVGNSLKYGSYIDSLYRLLTAHDFDTVPLETTYTSDHLSFEWQGIPAVTIGERDIYDIIHTKNDVAANVDLDELERLCDALFAYVIEYDN